ncbi:MAG: hypothetical protein P8R31_12575 [Mariniblastus sp.]|nr:hypothetical protein [Mariniblastus sp.]
MVGEIDIAVVGHDAKLVFLGDHIVFRVTDYLSAVAFMRTPMPDLKPLGKLMAFSETGLKVHIGKRKPIEILPKPSRIARLLSPKVREIAPNN